MKIPRKYCMALILIMVLIYHSSVYAADSLYRLMHNDHDGLIIGEIISIDEDNIKVSVEKSIISSKDLNSSDVKNQLNLTEANIISSFKYGFFYDENDEEANPSLGDYVLMSIVKSGNDFKIAWGAYKVDNLDYKSLSVVSLEYLNMSSKMDAAAIKAFVNSDGEISEFSFDGQKEIVYAGEDKIVIFDGNEQGIEDAVPDELSNISDDVNNKEKSSSIRIIGGADGPTALYVTGSSRKSFIIPAIGCTFIVLVVGFIIGYFVKAKRSDNIL